jgi:hypothetical protein
VATGARQQDGARQRRIASDGSARTRSRGDWGDKTPQQAWPRREGEADKWDRLGNRANKVVMGGGNGNGPALHVSWAGVEESGRKRKFYFQFNFEIGVK